MNEPEKLAEDDLENCTENVRNCTLYSAEYYGYLYIFTPVTIIGIVLNCFNLAILSRTTFKGCSSTFTFLTAMSVADLIYLCLVCPVGITRCTEIHYIWQIISRQAYEIYFHHPMSNTFGTASVWLTTSVAVERFITVTKRSLAPHLCTKNIARVIIVFIYCFAFIIHIPYFFYRDISADGTREYTKFGESDAFKVYSWFRTILAKYIPIIVVIIFNLLLLASVCQSNKKMKTKVLPQSSVNRRQQQQMKCTAMLLGITFTFVICHMMEPFIHETIYKAIFGPCSILTETYRNSVMTVNILEAASFASNFIFYCVFNKEFAKGVKEVFKCKNCLSPKNNDIINEPKPQEQCQENQFDNKVNCQPEEGQGVVWNPDTMQRPHPCGEETEKEVFETKSTSMKMEFVSVQSGNH